MNRRSNLRIPMQEIAPDCDLASGTGHPWARHASRLPKGPQRFIPVSDYLFRVIAKSTTGRSLHPFLTVFLQPFLAKRQSFAPWKAFGFATLDVILQDGLHGLDPTRFLILR